MKHGCYRQKRTANLKRSSSAGFRAKDIKSQVGHPSAGVHLTRRPNSPGVEGAVRCSGPILSRSRTIYLRWLRFESKEVNLPLGPSSLLSNRSAAFSETSTDRAAETEQIPSSVAIGAARTPVVLVNEIVRRQIETVIPPGVVHLCVHDGFGRLVLVSQLPSVGRQTLQFPASSDRCSPDWRRLL